MPKNTTVERRQDPRFPAELSGTLTTFGESEMRLPVYVEDVSEGGARVALTQALEPGTFVRVEVVDSTLFCQVRYCQRRGSAYAAGLLVERVLLGNSHLGQLIERLLVGSVAVEQEHLS
jgi:hypothetical protein